jgi:hypothetical protein
MHNAQSNHGGILAFAHPKCKPKCEPLFSKMACSKKGKADGGDREGMFVFAGDELAVCVSAQFSS